MLGAVRIVLLGAPGSGKGTLGDRLAGELGLPHLSTGDLLRAEAAAGTGHGRRVAPYLARGALVPDDLTDAVVGPALAEARERGGYVLDGYPRTVGQAEHLADDVVVVHLALPDEVARRRLAGRAEGRADDADPAVIDRRIAVYHEQTAPLLDLYSRRGALVTVDGNQPPDEVAADVLAALAPHRG
jgi:adenylate kinase